MKKIAIAISSSELFGYEDNKNLPSFEELRKLYASNQSLAVQALKRLYLQGRYYYLIAMREPGEEGKPFVALLNPVREENPEQPDFYTLFSLIEGVDEAYFYNRQPELFVFDIQTGHLMCNMT